MFPDDTQDQPNTTQDAPEADASTEFDAAFAEYAQAAEDEAQGQSGGDEAEGADAPKDGADAGETGKVSEREDSAPANTTTDPFVGANEQQRAAWEAAQRQIRDLTHRYQSANGRISALMRKQAEAATAATGKGQNEAAADPAAALFSDPELKAFEEEYGEIAKPIKKLIGTLSSQNQALQAQLSDIQTEREAALSVAVIDREESVLSQAHPDWKDAAATPAFAAWIRSQPDTLKQIALQNYDSISDGASAAKLLSLFKAETGFSARKAITGNRAPAAPGPQKPDLSERRRRQIEAAAGMPSRGPSAGSGPVDDFESAFKYYAAR